MEDTPTLPGIGVRLINFFCGFVKKNYFASLLQKCRVNQLYEL
jgi:hypothetical protein